MSESVVFKSDEDDDTVWRAARENNVAKVKQFTLQYLVSVNATDEDGKTPLVHALECYSDDVLNWLMDAGADPNQADHVGVTPLHVASERGNATAVALLLKNRANPDVQDDEGRAPADLTQTEEIKTRLQGYMPTKLVTNEQFDEVMEVGDSESDDDDSFDTKALDEALEQMKNQRSNKEKGETDTAPSSRPDSVDSFEEESKSDAGEESKSDTGEVEIDKEHLEHMEAMAKLKQQREALQSIQKQHEEGRPADGGGGGGRKAGQKSGVAKGGESSSEGESSEDDDSSDDDARVDCRDIIDFKEDALRIVDQSPHLTPSMVSDIKEVFRYIDAYTPPEHELPATFKPFVPAFIPAVGDNDAMLQIPPPVENNRGLGLKMLAECALHQSDPAVIDMSLRSLATTTIREVAAVPSLPVVTPVAISKWIKDVNGMHANKPLAKVTYEHAMPDIEALMQIWPAEVEDLLGEIKLPTSNLNVSLEQYVRIVCAVLDIPVHSLTKPSSERNTVVKALHVVMSLYLEMRDSQHFRSSKVDMDVLLDKAPRSPVPAAFQQRGTLPTGAPLP